MPAPPDDQKKALKQSTRAPKSRPAAATSKPRSAPAATNPSKPPRGATSARASTAAHPSRLTASPRPQTLTSMPSFPSTLKKAEAGDVRRRYVWTTAVGLPKQQNGVTSFKAWTERLKARSRQME